MTGVGDTEPPFEHIPARASDGRIHFVPVDVADYELLKRYTWHVARDATTRYAHSQHKTGGHRVNFAMAHLILGPPPGPGMRVNYRNGNGLDCRRANLEWATQSQILAKRKPSGGASRFKGVAWDRHTGKWVARFRGKNLGRTTDEEQAARWFDAAAREFWGPEAYQNFPCEHPQIYWCPTAGQFECPDCDGFDVCCDRPARHRSAACCRGTGFADYAAVPCPSLTCPTRWTTKRAR